MAHMLLRCVVFLLIIYMPNCSGTNAYYSVIHDLKHTIFTITPQLTLIIYGYVWKTG